jgi:hypothetical protein
MADGFLGRWSQRKQAVRKGKEVAAEPEQVAAPPPLPSPQPSPASGRGSLQAPSPLGGEGGGEGEALAPPPTLEDVQALSKDSDFTRFVQPGVAPEVRNAALKKLFTDPHFNVMDGLDIYIDDYSKPDPLPPEMLRQLAGAKFLKLFDDEEAKSPTDSAGPDAPAPESVAQSSTRTAQALPPAEDHADPDLRLQQDDAPGPAGPGAGSG